MAGRARRRAGLVLLCAGAAWGGGLARAADGGVDLLDHYQFDVYKPRFVEGVAADGTPVFRLAPRLSPVPGEFALRKPEGTLRVFLLGGSVVELYDSAGPAFTLEKVLAGLLPRRRFEVVRCGSTGYDSARESVVLDEILGRGPDAVVLLSCLNESQPLAPRWLVRLIGLLRPFPPAYAGARARLAAWLARRRVSPGASGDGFARNLRSMARRARAAGVPLVLCTMPVNLRGMPPPGSPPMGSEAFFSAWTDFERGRWAAAARGFGACAAAHPRDPFAEHFWGRSLDLGGDCRAAAPHYERAWGLAGAKAPVPELNRIVRRVASEEGVAVAELEAAFASASPCGVTGWSLMEDDIHWLSNASPLASLAIGRALARGAGGRPLIAPTGAWRRDWLENPPASLLGASIAPPPDRARSWVVFRHRMWEPLRESSADGFSERVLAMIGTVDRAHPGLAASIMDLRAFLEAQVAGNIWDSGFSIDSWWPALLGHVGEHYRRKGRLRESLAYFSEALRLDPSLRRVRLRKAVAHLAAGDPGSAAAELAAVPDWRKDPETRLWLGRFRWMPPAGAPVPSRVRAAGAPRRPPAGPGLAALVAEGARILSASSPSGGPGEGGARKLLSEGVAAFAAGEGRRALESFERAARADQGALGAIGRSLKALAEESLASPDPRGRFRAGVAPLCAKGGFDCAPVTAPGRPSP